MNRSFRLATCSAVLAVTFLSLRHAEASFEDYLTGGRAAGVNGAMTAAADDVFALYYNPAGVVRVKRPEAGIYGGKFYPGLSDGTDIKRSFIGYVHPLKGQAVGVSFLPLTVSGLYREEISGLTYGRTVWKTLSLGASLKYYRKSLDTSFDSSKTTNDAGNVISGVRDPLANSDSGQGWGTDVGAMMALEKGWSVGAVITNLNQPTVEFGQEDGNRVYRVVKLGASKQWERGYQLMFDIWHSRFTEEETRLLGGFEKWWKNRFALRLGGGVGDRDYKRVSTGFSYRWTNFQLDYGFMIPLSAIEGTEGSHHVSLLMRFGSEKAAPPPPAPVEDTEAEAQAEIVAVEKDIADHRENPIIFANDSDKLLPISDTALNRVSEVMKKYPKLHLQLEGHTDSSGSDAYNLILSRKRADAIRNYLVKKGGISADRITTTGYGASRPIATNSTRVGRETNRRVEFIFQK